MIQGPFEKTPAEIPDALRGRPVDGVLLAYQRRAVALCASSPLAVIEKSRRIGLTWGLASLAVLCAARSRAARGKNTFYIGYNLDMAREFIDVCGMWATSFGHIGVETGEEIFEDDNGKPVQAFRIQFASGFKIVALPSKPRSLRGMQGQIILDEAAFHDNLAEMLKAAMAMLIWGGNVIVVSTHDGVSNAFNELLDKIKSGEQKGHTLRITFADAMADGLYERVCLVKGDTPTPEGKLEYEADIRAFYSDNADEELDCIPRAGSGSLIKPEDLAAAEHPDAGKPGLYTGGLWYGGRDVARRKDGAIIWGFELVGDVLWLRDRYEEYGVSFRAQDDAMDALFASRRVASCWIDQTGMGEKVVEDAQQRHGAYRVVGVLLTGPNRLDLATSLVQRFERGLIRVPADPVIRSDLRAIKKVSGPQGQVRLVNDGDVHADRFWAAGLACRAADTGPASFDYTPVPKRTALDRAGDWDDDDRNTRNASFRRAIRRKGAI
ncbi:MAG TPA: terminase family protein [Caulobacteraceae bacterium]|nr:terminase family protein [Caulobacteraceae bacterium]